MLPLPLPGGIHLSVKEEREIARWAARQYRNGASVREIAADLGRSYGYARKVLKLVNVTMRSTGRKPQA